MFFTRSKWGLFLAGLTLMVAVFGMSQCRLDLSQDRLFSLTEPSKDVLAKLDVPIYIYSNFQDNSYEEEVMTTLLQSIAIESTQVHYSQKAPNDSNQSRLQKKPLENGSVLIRSKHGQKRLITDDLFGIEQDHDVFRGEEAVMNAIISLEQPSKTIIYISEGHREPSRFQDRSGGVQRLAKEIEAIGGTVLTLNPEMSAIPDDCQLFIVISPKKRWNATAIKNLDDYMARGGRTIIFFDPFFRSGLEALLEKRGLIVEETLVVDEESSYLSGSTSLSPILLRHPITKSSIDSQMGVVLLQSRSFRRHPLSSNLDYVPLLSSTDSAWADSDDPLRKERHVVLKGPFDVGVLLEDFDNDSAEKWVVFGDSDWIQNQWIDTQGNRDLINDVIHYLVEPQGYLRIPSKRSVVTPIWFNSAIKWILGGLLLVVIPGLSFMMAFRVYRKKD